MRGNHRIYLMINGITSDVRYWKNVPRTGDRILLREGNDYVPYIITAQTWGVAEDDCMTEWPDVNLALERAK